MNTYHNQLKGFAGYCMGRGVLGDNRCGERFAKKNPLHITLNDNSVTLYLRRIEYLDYVASKR